MRKNLIAVAMCMMAGSAFAATYQNGQIYVNTETDPVFGASVAHSITSTDYTHWNTAYSWGNHASAGYLTSSSIGAATDYTGSPTNGYVLKFSTSNSKWGPVANTLANLSDVSLGSPTNGYVLRFSTATSNWTPQTDWTNDTRNLLTMGTGTFSGVCAASIYTAANPLQLSGYMNSGVQIPADLLTTGAGISDSGGISSTASISGLNGYFVMKSTCAVFETPILQSASATNLLVDPNSAGAGTLTLGKSGAGDLITANGAILIRGGAEGTTYDNTIAKWPIVTPNTVTNTTGIYPIIGSGFPSTGVVLCGIFATDDGFGGAQGLVLCGGQTTGLIAGLKIDYNGNVIMPVTGTPVSHTADGVPGQIAWDASYDYRCIGTNSWTRSAHASW